MTSARTLVVALLAALCTALTMVASASADSIPLAFGDSVDSAFSPALASTSASTAVASSTSPVTFAETGRGAGQIQDPRGMAVDESTGAPSSGDVYVADLGNRRVDKFDSEGHFELAWGFGVADSNSQELQTCGPESSNEECFAGVYNNSSPGAIADPVYVAVSPSSHDVYVDGGGYRIQEFNPSGEFLLMFGHEVNTTTKGDVCTKTEVAAGDTCGEGVPGSGAGQLDYGRHPVAIDASGHVWVGDASRLEEFEANGAFLEEVPVSGAGTIKGLAIDSTGDLYVLDTGAPGVQKLDSSGTEIEKIDVLASASYNQAITLDGAGDLYVADREGSAPAVFRVFDSSGKQIEQFGFGEVFGKGGPEGIALGDTAKALYSDSFDNSNGEHFAAQRFALPASGPLLGNEGAEKVLPTEATLKATVNPEGYPTAYRFEYGATSGYGASVPDSLPASFEDRQVSLALTKLIPSTVYHWRIVAESECEPVAKPGHVCAASSADQEFETLPAVAIDAQWATEVAATSATFHGELNPLGEAAQWWVEYGTDTSYQHKTEAQNLAAGSADVPVSVHVTVLQPDTVYHYRFAASDEREGKAYTVHGTDQTMTTQSAASGFQLADNRAWEMVSPPNKHGATIVPMFNATGVMQAAGNGEALTYITLGSIEAKPEGNRVVEDSQVLARRGAEGWRSKDITLPHTEVSGYAEGHGFEYRLFSSDLAGASVEPRDSTRLSDEASERTPYLRDNFAEPSTYRPLVSGCPKVGEPCPPTVEEHADVPPGTEFGGAPTSSLGYVEVRGASPDLGHVILQSSVALAAGAPNRTIYEWSSGQLRLVSVLPAGEGGAVIQGELGAGDVGVRNAVSADGSRVFWNPGTETPPGSALYVRDTVTEETVRLDSVQPGASGRGAEKPVFQGASADGTKAFFTDTQRLTPTASSSGADLYECKLTLSAGKLVCALTDLTANGAQGSNVQGILPGLSEDGMSVYLVANGVLTVMPNGQDESASTGNCVSGISLAPTQTCNLYALREDPETHAWETRFVATLAIEDWNDWGAFGVTNAEARFLSAEASPSGRYLAFMSKRSLTGYDNRDAVSGEPDEEVYRYDAEANGGEGELTCVSCNPSGARPAGLRKEREFIPPFFDQGWRWANRWVAANVPDPIDMSLLYSAYQPRFVLDSGRVLFNAVDSLVPADSNGAWDVYEYESAGSGSCAASSGGAAIARVASGCVALLSSGTADEESALLDASESGNDVFFFSSAQLSVLDEDGVYDVYDARIGGTPATRRAVSECLGEACQPLPATPIDATPSSSSFAGPGNLVAPKVAAKPKRATRAQRLAAALRSCRKRYRRSKARRTKCERQAGKRYGARGSRKANSSRRGK